MSDAIDTAHLRSVVLEHMQRLGMRTDDLADWRLRFTPHHALMLLDENARLAALHDELLRSRERGTQLAFERAGRAEQERDKLRESFEYVDAQCRRIGDRNAEAMRILGVEFGHPTEGIAEGAQRVVADRDKLRALLGEACGLLTGGGEFSELKTEGKRIRKEGGIE